MKKSRGSVWELACVIGDMVYVACEAGWRYELSLIEDRMQFGWEEACDQANKLQAFSDPRRKVFVRQACTNTRREYPNTVAKRQQLATEWALAEELYVEELRRGVL